MKSFPQFFRLVLLALLPIAPLRAETGYDGWLRYAPIEDPAAKNLYAALPTVVVSLDDTAPTQSARDELARAVKGMLNVTLRTEKNLPAGAAILLGTLGQLKTLAPGLPLPTDLAEDGFWLKSANVNGRDCLVIAAPNPRGVLYGAFAFLRKIALHESIAQLDEKQNPYAPIRFLNHWDNLNGTIERGYAGPSIFWENGHVPADLSRVRDYARLLASVGINGCSINNVNADSRVITAEYLPEVARVADALRPWGVRLILSLDFASPRKNGGIDSYDPLDPRTVEFWKKSVDAVYQAVPDLAGFVLKADSEGRLGPSEYGRTHADAANVIARALKPHGGVLFYRGFVYNNRLDWRDLSLDRAKAAYDNFHQLDGQFEDNVIIQIKNGPIDFQVREPASPLLAGLKKTNEAIELQITQEYLGQQRHVVYSVPLWKETLDFDLQANGPGTPVKSLVAGKVFKQPLGGFIGVSNVGQEVNWLGHHLAMANLYGFGRLAWNPDSSSRQIAEDWTKLTFGHDPAVVQAITAIQLNSWPAYEKYTGVLGIGGLTDIIGAHFGPAVESSEYNGWGQWHRSNPTGTGMNRSIAGGTGYIAQYPAPVAQLFESLATCPDDLLLFMHHVPYTHVLHNGKTVIQYIYDAHYEGAAQAAQFVEDWKKLRGKIDDQRYSEVLGRLEYQAGHAMVWRDAINNWFLKTSGIPDASGRAGHFPGRIEAEAMTLDGYAVLDITPFETASGEKAIQLTNPTGAGTAAFAFEGTPGTYDLAVQYYDLNPGASPFSLSVAGKPIDAWVADGTLPFSQPNGHTATRRTIRNVALKPGDSISLTGTANGRERAVVDYVEIIPHRAEGP